jgi:hypothetical protein
MKIDTKLPGSPEALQSAREILIAECKDLRSSFI